MSYRDRCTSNRNYTFNLSSPMRKIVLTLLFFVSVCNCFAQIKTCAYYDGYWGNWKTWYNTWSIRGSYAGFILYLQGVHPSNYSFKFVIDSYSPPSKDVLKAHRKANQWFEYTGTVEYYVIESYPTIKDLLKHDGFPYWCPANVKTQPIAKRVTRAKIKIAPYKTHPQVYNIWFDGVGVGIDMDTQYFAD